MSRGSAFDRVWTDLGLPGTPGSLDDVRFAGSGWLPGLLTYLKSVTSGLARELPGQILRLPWVADIPGDGALPTVAGGPVKLDMTEWNREILVRNLFPETIPPLTTRTGAKRERASPSNDRLVRARKTVEKTQQSGKEEDE